MARSLPLPAAVIHTETQALRRLARALVVDEATAADLVQDTWVAAVAHPPDLDRPVRPWLARVLHNRAISRRRAADRAPAIAPAPADRDLEHDYALRQLVDELAALPEADQALLHARYWDGCNATECARRFGCPASTIRTRLARALARLRKRLDARAGDREAWVMGLLPFAPPRAGIASSLRAIGLAIGFGAVVTATIAVAPNGCGAAVVEGTNPTSSNMRPSEARSAWGRTRAAAITPSSEPVARTTSPRKEKNTKFSLHVALQDLDQLLAQCRTGRGEASLRLQPIVVFTEDAAPFVESVGVAYHENLGADELECIEQTLLTLDIPPAELVAWMPTRLTPTIDAFFDSDGVVVQQISRGPTTDLMTRTKDGSDLVKAVGACVDTIEVRLTFEPITGELAEVVPDPAATPAARRCVEQAIRGAVAWGIPFEPRVREDAVLVCTFAPAPDCKRLGPDGGYIELD